MVSNDSSSATEPVTTQMSSLNGGTAINKSQSKVTTQSSSATLTSVPLVPSGHGSSWRSTTSQTSTIRSGPSERPTKARRMLFCSLFKVEIKNNVQMLCIV